MSSELEDQISVFEKHFSDHIIDIAEELARQFNEDNGAVRKSGFFILLGLGSYFEAIGRFINGSFDEAPFENFETGFRAVYSDTLLSRGEIGRVFDWYRNGMYHLAMPKQSTTLSREYPVAISVESYGLEINPVLLVVDIRKHLNEFVAMLRNPNSGCLRQNFQMLIAKMDDSYEDGPCTSSVQTTPTTPNPADDLRRLRRLH